MFRKCALILLLSLLTMPAIAKNSDHHKKIILQFNTMFGVDAPYLSTPPPDATPPGNGPLATDPLVRGVLGDYTRWAIDHVNGKLFSDGTLIINVKGLVFFENGNPTNDETDFRALVSCQLTPDIPPDPSVPGDTGKPATFSNLITDPPSPVHTPITKGNANINAKVKLPTPCVAPVVMILSGDGSVWFAVTGN